MNTIVIGLGNPILADDGVGVHAAYEIERRLAGAGNEQITVIEASAGGLRLMELMVGYDRAIIIDALLHANGSAPGTIHRLTLDHLRAISPTQHSASAHDTTLITALDSGRVMGLHLPQDVVIFAIDVVNVEDFSEEMTPAVAAAIPRVATAVIDELGGIPHDLT